jgi:hypothetical protein
VSFSSPLFSPSSPSLSVRAALQGEPMLGAQPLGRYCSAPSVLVRSPSGPPRRGPDGASCPSAAHPGARPPGARSHVPVRADLARLRFKFSLIHVLRHTLHRSIIYFKFRFNSALRALRRAMIRFNFSLDNVLCHGFRRMMFRFKFSLISVCRRALRRATFRFKFRFNSRVALRASSRDNSF